MGFIIGLIVGLGTAGAAAWWIRRCYLFNLQANAEDLRYPEEINGKFYAVMPWNTWRDLDEFRTVYVNYWNAGLWKRVARAGRPEWEEKADYGIGPGGTPLYPGQ